MSGELSRIEESVSEDTRRGCVGTLMEGCVNGCVSCCFFYVLLLISFLLGAIGFMPQSVPHIVPNVLVSFICAMQYNTFRKHNDVTLATTFCTNNLRQTALHFMQWVKTKERAAMRKSLDYLVVIAAFLGGAVVSALACRVLDGRAVWVACGVLVPVLAALVLFNKDKKPDKQKEA